MSLDEIKVGDYRLTPGKCALLVCDIQEEVAPVMEHFEGIVANTNRLGRSRQSGESPI